MRFIYFYFSAVQPDFVHNTRCRPRPLDACILPRPEVQAVYVSLLGISSADSLISGPGKPDGITQNISDKIRIESHEKKNVYKGRFVLNVWSVQNCVSS